MEDRKTLLPDFVILPVAFYEGLETRFINASSPDANYSVKLPAVWNEFSRFTHQIRSNDPSGAVYGLCDTPESQGMKRAHDCESLYLAGVQVDEDASVNAGMKRWKIPGGLYAKFEHHGSVEKLGDTIRYIRETWLPESEFRKHTGPDIERYDHRFDPFSNQSVIEIFISIR